jgi:AhpD family alkylhydroperoxidase
VNAFAKRHYHSPRELARDLAYLFTHATRTRGVISPAFRERLMMAVSSVNACRYCTRFHAQVALTTGISRAEIAQILDGEFAHAPERELPALLYAQHWTETNAQPDPATRAKFIEAYGEDTAHAIEYVLRMIHISNLTGNTFDYVLYRLSFGRLGASRRHVAPSA